jgi:hypothetical protein
MSSNEVEYAVEFNKSAEYRTQYEVNQYDINKLFGLSMKMEYHKTNSARFGWRWVTDRRVIELLAYLYVDGKKTYEVLRELTFNQFIILSITVEETEYIFWDGMKQWRFPKPKSNPHCLKYQLFPYFGGDETAPHRITIGMERT